MVIIMVQRCVCVFIVVYWEFEISHSAIYVALYASLCLFLRFSLCGKKMELNLLDFSPTNSQYLLAFHNRTTQIFHLSILLHNSKNLLLV